MRPIRGSVFCGSILHHRFMALPASPLTGQYNYMYTYLLSTSHNTWIHTVIHTHDQSFHEMFKKAREGNTTQLESRKIGCLGWVLNPWHFHSTEAAQLTGPNHTNN